MISFTNGEENRALAMNLNSGLVQGGKCGQLSLKEESPRRVAGRRAWTTKDAVQVSSCSLAGF